VQGRRVARERAAEEPLPEDRQDNRLGHQEGDCADRQGVARARARPHQARADGQRADERSGEEEGDRDPDEQEALGVAPERRDPGLEEGEWDVGRGPVVDGLQEAWLPAQGTPAEESEQAGRGGEEARTSRRGRDVHDGDDNGAR
jgi:hypothetical protein